MWGDNKNDYNGAGSIRLKKIPAPDMAKIAHQYGPVIPVYWRCGNSACPNGDEEEAFPVLAYVPADTKTTNVTCKECKHVNTIKI